ncbi:PP2C family protein-serine/threonine phosphatase [Streptomyces meridianus]|uniref:Serine/threonine-protein phosphatase n=1 Tax=Streptomyces meridianus TaxID=2938945 RepID=A0ABT0X0F4_9ACTN|nr:PP2C family serine/threonine-protein phosphatase [Streptomyces meridianus]MCM2575969.1 serine/threonine-protein phosphatase [Streptomyces meridianus]
MPQQPRPSACPRCDEPLEAGDLFCEACGAPVTVPAETPSGPGEQTARSGAPDAGRDPLPGATACPDPGTPDPRVAGPFGVPSVSDAPPDPSGGGDIADVALCVACRTGTVGADGCCENCGHAQPRERDHMEREVDGAAAVSDRGLRHHRNEDAFDVSVAELPDGTPAVVAIVCDGVSSATRPDEASATASRTAGEALREALPAGVHPQRAVHEAILRAGTAVTALADEPAGEGTEPSRSGNAPACTVVATVIASGILTVGWVGDSRAYWVPDDRTAPPARLTEDDSWAARMVAAGLMPRDQAYADPRAHAITGWLGADAYELEPHTASYEPDGPGVLVVCTDGLWNYTESAAELALAVPADARTRPLHCCRALVGLALDAGGHDNVTVAVLPFVVPPGAARPGA